MQADFGQLTIPGAPNASGARAGIFTPWIRSWSPCCGELGGRGNTLTQPKRKALCGLKGGADARAERVEIGWQSVVDVAQPAIPGDDEHVHEEAGIPWNPDHERVRPIWVDDTGLSLIKRSWRENLQCDFTANDPVARVQLYSAVDDLECGLSEGLIGGGQCSRDRMAYADSNGVGVRHGGHRVDRGYTENTAADPWWSVVEPCRIIGTTRGGLPMRWLLVDKIDVLVSGETAQGRKAWPADSAFFADHFPKFPVVPGVLLMEALAQLAGKLIGYTVRQTRGDWPFPILSMMNGVKFRKFVRPDEEVILMTRLTSIREDMAVVQSRAKCGGRVVAQAEQIFVFNAVPLDNDQDAATLERLERAEMKRLWADYPEDE